MISSNHQFVLYFDHLFQSHTIWYLQQYTLVNCLVQSLSAILFHIPSSSTERLMDGGCVCTKQFFQSTRSYLTRWCWSNKWCFLLDTVAEVILDDEIIPFSQCLIYNSSDAVQVRLNFKTWWPAWKEFVEPTEIHQLKLLTVLIVIVIVLAAVTLIRKNWCSQSSDLNRGRQPRRRRNNWLLTKTTAWTDSTR